MWAVRSGDSEGTRNEAAPLSRGGQARHPVRGERLRGNAQEPRCLNVDHDAARDVVDFDI